MDEVGVGGLRFGSDIGDVRSFGRRAVIPVEGCCAVEEDRVEGAGGGVMRGCGEEVGLEGGEGSEEGREGLRAEDVDVLERS